MTECPQCGSTKIFAGGHRVNIVSGGHPYSFRPKGLKVVALSNADVPIRKRMFTACSSCGLLWSKIDSEKLKKVILENGTKKTKEKL